MCFMRPSKPCSLLSPGEQKQACHYIFIFHWSGLREARRTVVLPRELETSTLCTAYSKKAWEGLSYLKWKAPDSENSCRTLELHDRCRCMTENSGGDLCWVIILAIVA